MLQRIPPITRNLLLLNVVCFLLQSVLTTRGINLDQWLGLHFVMASQFKVWQLVTYLFLHGNLTHLFFNMFSLWMFGRVVEGTLGAKRFLLLYAVSGIGAGLCQELFQLSGFLYEGMMGYENVVQLDGTILTMDAYLNQWTTIGASGACYGVLLAFGMLYPNERIMLLIPPIPLKAKYFVMGYAAIELFSAYTSNDNVAHFAHLGGMLFAWGLLRWWRKQSKRQPQFTGWQTYSAPQRKASLWQRLVSLFNRTTRRTTEGNARHTATRQSDYEQNIRSHQEEARMDEILDKVRRSGYDSLTPEEKHELFRISHR